MVAEQKRLIFVLGNVCLMGIGVFCVHANSGSSLTSEMSLRKPGHSLPACLVCVRVLSPHAAVHVSVLPCHPPVITTRLHIVSECMYQFVGTVCRCGDWWQCLC